MRRRQNSPLPKYVQRRSYGVIYTPYLGKGKKGKPINLGPSDMSVREVWDAFERETAQPKDTLKWLLSEYHASDRFKSRSPRTQKDYEAYREKLTAYPMANGKPFGTAQLSKIKRTSIQKYLDKHPSPIMANRQIQFLKAAWNWALNRYEHVPENPCVGVELNKQEARTRYVTQAEYAAFKETVGGYIPVFMELGYLLRARWSEVQQLTTNDLLDEGVRVTRSKGSRSEITAWTPRLRAAVDACRQYHAEAPTPVTGAFLIHDKRGKAIKQNSFQTAWGRAMRAWVAKGNERFTYHDLKAAGYSDQEVPDAGHKSPKMDAVYGRKLRVVEPPK